MLSAGRLYLSPVTDAANVSFVALTTARCLSLGYRPHQAGRQKYDTEGKCHEHALRKEAKRVERLWVGRRQQEKENVVHRHSDASDLRTDAEQAAKNHHRRDRNRKPDKVLRVGEEIEMDDIGADRGEHEAHHGGDHGFRTI